MKVRGTHVDGGRIYLENVGFVQICFEKRVAFLFEEGEVVLFAEG